MLELHGRMERGWSSLWIASEAGLHERDVLVLGAPAPHLLKPYEGPALVIAHVATRTSSRDFFRNCSRSTSASSGIFA
jgi:hypothetical protein